MKYIPQYYIKFETQSRSSSLVIYMIFEIADLDPKSNTLRQIWSQNCNMSDFYEICYLEQIEHANYEYFDSDR